MVTKGSGTISIDVTPQIFHCRTMSKCRKDNKRNRDGKSWWVKGGRVSVSNSVSIELSNCLTVLDTVHWMFLFSNQEANFYQRTKRVANHP